MGFEVNRLEIAPAPLPPNLHATRIYAHERAPFRARFSQEVEHNPWRVRRYDVRFSFQLPAGSEYGYLGNTYACFGRLRWSF